MGQWHQTGCVLCAQNCGLEIRVENGRMVKVRPDKSNPQSQGYACRKGLNVLYHQYPADRLTTPLKKVNGRFEPISWDRAMAEIAGKMRAIRETHGPRSFAFMGGSAQGGHMEAAFGLTWLRGMGSQYYYSSAGQEFSDFWWLCGRILGKQYHIPIPDEHATEMLIAWGWNGMMSHQMPRARKTLAAIARDPDRILVAVDPRRSETAAIANLHIPVRPGTDALLLKAMLALILEEGWENQAYLKAHVHDWERVRPFFEKVDIRAALAVCELGYDQVHAFCRLLTTRRWCMHPDLGLYMGRKGVESLYLLMVLGAACGIFGVRGGNNVPGFVVPMGFHADERDPANWRTVAADMPAVAAGSFPPAVMPEEILSDHPERLRAVYVSAVNPLRSYPDTQAFAAAFARLDLLVAADIVLSETARLAHYVLPCRTYYEAWDTTFFPNHYPRVFLQLRRPVVAPPPGCLEAAQIITLLADRLGLVPEIPTALREAARGDRLAFGARLMAYAEKEPRALAAMPFILAQTLGNAWDSAALAGLWGLLMTAPKAFRENAGRAGFAPGPDLGDRIFQALLDTPQGLWVGETDPEKAMAAVRTPSGKLELFIPELAEGIRRLDAREEAKDLAMDPAFPLILSAGRHMDYNANTLMRNPEWNQGKRACTVALSPKDAEALGLADKDPVKVTTRAGSARGELQVSAQIRPGTVIIPHGFGLIYGEEMYGLNVNHLTQSSHRSAMGTPLHRFVPCRVEGEKKERPNV